MSPRYSLYHGEDREIRTSQDPKSCECFPERRDDTQIGNRDEEGEQYTIRGDDSGGVLLEGCGVSVVATKPEGNRRRL